MGMEKSYKTSKGETVIMDPKSWRYHIKGKSGRNYWLILTKDDHCGRGEYSEEFDIIANGEAEAKRIAQAIMDEDMIPELRISRVEYQGRAY